MSHRLIPTVEICSLEGLIFGYDLGALSAATQSPRKHFSLSLASLGLTVSLSLWGTICGSLLAGRTADRVRRRRLIVGCSPFYTFATISLVFTLANHWRLLPGVRFLSGMSIGGFTVGCPLHPAKVAPNAVRNRLISLLQLLACAGIAPGLATGAMLAYRLPPDLYWRYWRWRFVLGGVPAALLFFLLPYMPEAPKWLAAREDWQRACLSAKFLGRSHAVWHLDDSTQKASAYSPVRPERLFSRIYARPILLAKGVALFNQLSGANVLLVYMLDVLSSAG